MALQRPLPDITRCKVKAVGYFEPNNALTGRKRIVIIPHATLHYLPFSTLLDENGAPLCKEHAVIYEPSLTALKYCREKKLPQGEKLVAYALGNFSSKDITPLPATEREVHDIAKIFNEHMIIKEKLFTREKIESEVKGKNILHFATHGIINADNPKGSGLITSNGTFTIEEVLNLSIDPKIVVLSACNTGVGKLFPGDDQVSLTRAFMCAGTPSILSSLWSVSDETTAKLMEYFYTGLSQNMDKGEALRQAELKLMEDYPHPFYWSPFILTGDWN